MGLIVVPQDLTELVEAATKRMVLVVFYRRAELADITCPGKVSRRSRVLFSVPRTT